MSDKKSPLRLGEGWRPGPDDTLASLALSGKKSYAPDPKPVKKPKKGKK